MAALVLGAGRGERLGAGASKAFVSLEGRPLFAHALAALVACPEIGCIVPVVRQQDLARFETLRSELGAPERILPAVVGGEERQDSLRAGLEALPAGVALVAVHDAARPLLRPADVSRVVEAAGQFGAAVLAIPLRDTVKRVRDGEVVETLDRRECWAAQTPQVVRRDWLLEALGKADGEGVRVT
ncbi:MAG: IspD/TarI family cytidylyltransferase, partial [Myxococcota bacterium]